MHYKTTLGWLIDLLKSQCPCVKKDLRHMLLSRTLLFESLYIIFWMDSTKYGSSNFFNFYILYLILKHESVILLCRGILKTVPHISYLEEEGDIGGQQTAKIIIFKLGAASCKLVCHDG